jgi:hypothetical protein
MVPVSIAITLTFALPFSFTLTLTLDISLLMRIRLALPSTLGTALLLLHGSRHPCVVIHRIKDSLHQSLICIRIILLSMSRRRGPMLRSTTTTLRLAYGAAG